LVSCGFGTAYEALLRLDVSGRDGLLVTGLGPVGLAAAMMGRAMGAGPVIGTDTSPGRRQLALDLGMVDHALAADAATLDAVLDLTAGQGCSATLDASGSAAARATALAATRTWGRCALVGEGGRLEVDVSPLLIHRQLTVHGSWVTSLGHMAQLLQDLVRWELRPERIVTHRFPLEEAEEAYAVAAAGATGKVCLVPA
jgi:threonine dehydrogenase-like Zn-dependent dehydrogenase